MIARGPTHYLRDAAVIATALALATVVLTALAGCT